MSRENAFAFIQTRTAQLLCAPWAGYTLAIVAVLACIGIGAALEGFGAFYYLPMVPAVMVVALLAGRRETAFAIVLAIAANVTLVSRESLTDTIANALLFAAVAWLISEGFGRLRASLRHARELSRRLARGDHMLQTILVSVPVVMLDRRGVIRSLTPSASALLAAPGALAIGEPFNLFVEDFDVETFAPRGTGAAASGSWVARRGDGQRLHLSIQLGINGDEGDPDYAILTLTDLTASHTADAQARELHAQLNRVWRLNSLGEMAASLSHELNQPLSAAATYLHAAQTDMKRAGPVADSAGRTVDMAKAQLLRAGEIIRRMRELLAHETRGLDVERTGKMIDDLQGVLEMIGRTGGATIEFLIDEEDDRVWAERIQFQQAMVNLVRNAVEALEGRPNPRVIVSGRAISAECYEVRVEDNGAGIATADMETIFRPLMSTKSGGMGLGLSVTRTIIESHGGVLKVEASPFGGAAFSFCLMRERELVDA
ncbi:ATP-binding protein [Brevundimonas sp.]|uniref:ATP-binding protein n=1 Tax=Brevundimonas sp. TaxID=1871086 RepID=UPI00286A8DB2|nr:ATP-binding protein [Brevundimonas sp.]